jgi:hypothetical protein
MKKIHELAKSKSSVTEVTFGAVTVRVSTPGMDLIKRNIREGQEALKRAQAVLIRPGVKLHRAKGKAIFFASPDSLDAIVREVDGVRTIGKFVGGRFKITQSTRSSVKQSVLEKVNKVTSHPKHV